MSIHHENELKSVAHYHTLCQIKIFSEWKDLVLEIIDIRKEKVETGLKNHNKITLTNHFKEWVKVVQYRREEMKKAIEFSNKRLMTPVLKYLYKVAKENEIRHRENKIKAFNFFKSRILPKAIKGWKEEANRIKERKIHAVTTISRYFRGFYVRTGIYLPPCYTVKNLNGKVSLYYDMSSLPGSNFSEIKNFCFVCPFQSQNGNAYVRVQITKQTKLLSTVYIYININNSIMNVVSSYQILLKILLLFVMQNNMVIRSLCL